MSDMTPKERVLRALKCEKLDRPPVASFTQSATIGLMESRGVFWPDAHYDAELMAKLGAGQYEVFGLEAVRAPFCLTVEAETLGCPVNPGKQDRTPMLKDHPFSIDDDPDLMDIDKFLSSNRAKVTLDAISLLADKYGDEVAVIAGNTGPFTLAGHLVGTEMEVMYIMLDPEAVHKWVAAANEIVKAYSQALSDAGADVIQLSEPSASTDLLSPDMFNEYAGAYLKDSLGGVKGAASVLHICGNTTDILENMIACDVTGLSVEEKVVPEEAPAIVKGRASLIGNVGVVDPFLQGTPEDVYNMAQRVAKAGFDIISPGCGMSALIPDENIKAFVKAIMDL